MSIAAVTSIAGPAAASRSGVIGSGSEGGVIGAAGGPRFDSAFGKALQSVSDAQATSDSLAKAAATGSVQDIHDVTLAASRAMDALYLSRKVSYSTLLGNLALLH